MVIERPDLSEVPAEVRAYIEFLEAQVGDKASRAVEDSAESIPLTRSEPDTTLNVITISRAGVAKRTPRHLYLRQRRGGMGVFDIDTDEDDPPAHLVIADEAQSIILFTDQGRAFRCAVQSITETDVRGRGRSLVAQLRFRPSESIVAALPEDGGTYVTLVSQRGWVRRVRKPYLNANMIQGMTFHNINEGGYLAGACWTNGEDDVFMATRGGSAIRFSEKQIPNRGCLGIRIPPDDVVITATGTSDDGHVFLLGDDGKGTIRQMAGFRRNKAPGAGGKVAIKCDALVAAFAIEPTDDLFVVSRLSKVIRFSAEEVPPKSGVVQGVICINLRSDEVVAATQCTRPPDAE